MMRKIVVSISLILVVSPWASGQMGKNNIYAEFGGNAVIYSINYDRIVASFPKNLLIARIGFSTLGFKNIGFPFEANILFGRNKHFFETGIGSTIGRSESDDYIGGENGSSNFYYFFTGRIGYRYVSRKGFLLRMAFIPTYDKAFYPWMGISLGKNF